MMQVLQGIQSNIAPIRPPSIPCCATALNKMLKLKGSLGLANPKSVLKLIADVISLIFLRFCCFVLLRRLAIEF